MFAVAIVVVLAVVAGKMLESNKGYAGTPGSSTEMCCWAVEEVEGAHRLGGEYRVDHDIGTKAVWARVNIQTPTAAGGENSDAMTPTPGETGIECGETTGELSESERTMVPIVVLWQAMVGSGSSKLKVEGETKAAAGLLWVTSLPGTTVGWFDVALPGSGTPMGRPEGTVAGAPGEVVVLTGARIAAAEASEVAEAQLGIACCSLRVRILARSSYLG